MAQIKLNSARDLEKFLNIIAEESVRKAAHDLGDVRSRTAEEEMRQATVARDLRNFSKTSTPTEKNEDDIEQSKKPTKKVAAAAPEAKPAPDAKPEKKEPAEDPTGADKHVTPPTPDTSITFTMIKDKLNSIRSGRSLRDKEIRQEFKDYFTSLDEEEQAALYAFLDGIAQVLTAGIEGENADNPSKDPNSIEMQQDDDEDDDEGDVPKRTVSKKHVSTKPVRTRSSSGEDTSPPIAVGSRQRTEALRLKIRELMG